MLARIVTALTVIPSVAVAHPGHGHTEPESWTHYLTEPLHLGLLGAAVTVGVVLWRVRRRRAA